MKNDDFPWLCKRLPDGVREWFKVPKMGGTDQLKMTIKMACHQ